MGFFCGSAAQGKIEKKGGGGGGGRGGGACRNNYLMLINLNSYTITFSFLLSILINPTFLK